MKSTHTFKCEIQDSFTYSSGVDFNKSWAFNMLTSFHRLHRKIQLQDTYSRSKAVILTPSSLQKMHMLNKYLPEVESWKHKFVAVTQVSCLGLTLDLSSTFFYSE